MEDRQLLDAYRRGEPRAFEEVYLEYVRPVFALLLRGFMFESGGRVCRFNGFSRSWEVENAVQDVFVKVFSPEARLAYDGLRPFRNYLFTIARNLIIDSIRAQSRQLVILDESPAILDESARDPTRKPSNPEDEAIDRQLHRDVETFLSRLPAADRALFEARIREGLSVEASARALAISEHKVKRGERRLRKSFFGWMRARGYFEGYRFGRAGLEKLLVLLMGQGGAA